MASSGPELPAEADRHSFSAAIENWRGWWHREVIASVDQVEVINERRQDSDLSPRYLFMSAMSAGIAVLGLLLSSPAVVIVCNGETKTMNAHRIIDRTTP